MSEKHLTELPWKTLAIKKQVKDVELTKAIVAYGKVDAKDRDAQVKSLDKILLAVAIVKRGYKDDKELVAYLDEIVKEARKTRVAAGAADAAETPEASKADAPEKPKVDADDENAIDAEAEEYKKDYKAKLTGALAQVRSRAPKPGEPPKPQLRFLSLLAGTGSSVLVATNVGGPARKVLKSLAGGGGGAFVAGDCIFEKGAHTFVVPTVPGGLAGKLAKALHAQTGAGYKVRVRTPDGSVVQDDETDPAPPAPVAAPVASGGVDELKTRVARLSSRLKEVMATPGDQGAAAKALAAEISASAKAGNTAGALAAVARLEALLAAIPTASSAAVAAAPPTSTATEDTEDTEDEDTEDEDTEDEETEDEETEDAPAVDPKREEWLQTYAELIPGYEEAVDREGGSNPEADDLIRKIQVVWQWAEDQVEVGGYAKGLAALQRVAPMFDLAVAAKEKGAGSVTEEVVGQRQFLLKRWAQIPGELHAEVAKLEQQIAAVMPEEDAGELGGLMNDYLDDFLSALSSEVNNSINEGNAAGLSALKKKVSADVLFAHLQSTPFVDGLVFQRIVIGAIEEFEAKLSA